VNTTLKIQDVYGESIVSLHEIDILLSYVLHKPKEFIYGHPQHTLTTSQQTKIFALLKRRRAGEPIAYLTGHKEFYGLDFLVSPAVLIPRPDTELLVEMVLDVCVRTNYTIADIGTGSGNIAITLKHSLPNCTVIATDVSSAALAIAKKNAKHLQTKLQFFQGDVLQALPKRLHHTIDVLIFNAPYLTKTEAKKANLAHEPQLALTAPGQPTELIERLLQQASEFLTPTGHIFLEIGYRQAQQVQKLCHRYFPTAQVSVQKDLGGFDRVVQLSKT